MLMLLLEAGGPVSESKAENKNKNKNSRALLKTPMKRRKESSKKRHCTGRRRRRRSCRLTATAASNKRKQQTTPSRASIDQVLAISPSLLPTPPLPSPPLPADSRPHAHLLDCPRDAVKPSLSTRIAVAQRQRIRSLARSLPPAMEP